MMQLPLPIEGEIVEIPLTKGKVAIVDAIDGDLAAFKWHTMVSKRTQYAMRHAPMPARTMVYIHRVILERILGRELERREFVDHIDGDGLNCVRSNLRLSTPVENQQNHRKRSDSTSGYKGVHWSTAKRKWRAQITANHKHKFLGCFDTPEEAYEAYCKAAKELHGEFARFE